MVSVQSGSVGISCGLALLKIGVYGFACGQEVVQEVPTDKSWSCTCGTCYNFCVYIWYDNHLCVVMALLVSYQPQEHVNIV